MFRVIKAVALAIFFLGMLSAGVIVAWGAVISIPSLDNFQNRMVAESTKIFDRTGNMLLYDVHGTMRRTTVPFDSISINIRNSTVAI